MSQTRHIVTLTAISNDVTSDNKQLVISTTGEHDFGRGSMGISEKRCSRKQLVIMCDDHSNYYVYSNGVNPSYLKKFDKNHYVQMTKGNEYELENGDCLSMLYEQYKFSVSIVKNNDFKEPVKAQTNSSTTTTTTTTTNNNNSQSNSQGNSSQGNNQNNNNNNNQNNSNKRKDFDDNDEQINTIVLTKKQKPDLPLCTYGEKCFRKNPQHFEEFSHPWKDKDYKVTTTVHQQNDSKPKISNDNQNNNDNNQNDMKPKVTNDIQNNTQNYNSIKSVLVPKSTPPTSVQQPTTTTTTTTPQTNTTTPTTTTNTTTSNTSTTSKTPTTSTTNKPITDSPTIIGASYKKKKVGEVKHRTLAFPFISTYVYGFDVDKAIPIAAKEIKSYLNYHQDEDDIKLVMLVDKSVYSNRIMEQFKKLVDINWTDKFEIKSVDFINDNSQFSFGCKYFATETTWRLKRTAQNKLLYDLVGPSLEQDTKLKYPNPGKAGTIYPVGLGDDNTLRIEYGVENLLLVVGPNLNEMKPDCLADYDDANPILIQTYRALFSALDQI